MRVVFNKVALLFFQAVDWHEMCSVARSLVEFVLNIYPHGAWIFLMNKHFFSLNPQWRKGLFFFFFTGLLCCVVIGGGFSSANAADQVTISWRANPQNDNVLGYRIYFGAESRFDGSGLVKAGFSYTYYLDLSESKLCLQTESGPVCEPFTEDDVDCTGLFSETPRCTLYNLDEGRTYFAMTAYSAQAESDYTHELTGFYRSTVTQPSFIQEVALLQQVYTILLD